MCPPTHGLGISRSLAAAAAASAQQVTSIRCTKPTRASRANALSLIGLVLAWLARCECESRSMGLSLARSLWLACQLQLESSPVAHNADGTRLMARRRDDRPNLAAPHAITKQDRPTQRAADHRRRRREGRLKLVRFCLAWCLIKSADSFGRPIQSMAGPVRPVHHRQQQQQRAQTSKGAARKALDARVARSLFPITQASLYEPFFPQPPPAGLVAARA